MCNVNNIMVWSINLALKLMIIYTSIDVYNGYQPILAALQFCRNEKRHTIHHYKPLKEGLFPEKM